MVSDVCIDRYCMSLGSAATVRFRALCTPKCESESERRETKDERRESSGKSLKLDYCRLLNEQNGGCSRVIGDRVIPFRTNKRYAINIADLSSATYPRTSYKKVFSFKLYNIKVYSECF